LSVALVLLSAAVGALALVLLRKAALDEPGPPVFSFAVLWSMLRHRPVWTAGVAAMVVELLVQVLALATGPISTVQVLVVMELPFCLVLSRLVLGGRLAVREWSAISAMTVGVIVLLAALAPQGGDAVSPAPATWLFGLTATVAAIAIVLAAGRRTGAAPGTALAGIAAGMSAGLVAVLVKPVTSIAGHGVAAVLATWQAWAALGAGAAAFLLLQNALRAGRLVAAQPGITLANPLLAAFWGVVVFHEQVRTGWWLSGAGLGAALLVAGAVLLSRSPLLEGREETPRQVGLTVTVRPVVGSPARARTRSVGPIGP
jgi:drug/metabolite transporter (DMT)-like permease